MYSCYYARPRGAFWNSAIRPSVRPSVRLSVPWRSCLGYRHAGCLRLSHRRPSEMCGLRTRPRTDVDPPRFWDPWTDADGLIGGETICHRRTAIGRGHIVWPPPGRNLVLYGLEASPLAKSDLLSMDFVINRFS